MWCSVAKQCILNWVCVKCFSSTRLCSAVQFNERAYFGAVQCSAVLLCISVQYSAVQCYCVFQCSTVQYSAVQCCMVLWLYSGEVGGVAGGNGDIIRD